jgi:hypothetical protein
VRISPGKKARAIKTRAAGRARAAKKSAAQRKAVGEKMKRRATEKQTRAILEGYATVRQADVYGELRKVTLSLDGFTTDVLRQVGRGSMSEGARHLTRLVNLESLKPAQSIDIPPPQPPPQVGLFDAPAALPPLKFDCRTERAEDQPPEKAVP